VLPLIRNTPYGKRIQNKLQREQMDHFGGYHSQQAIVNMTLSNHGMGVARNPLADVYAAGGYSAAPLHAAPLMQHVPHAIDGYVLQGHSSHNAHPGAAPGQPGGYNAFAGAAAYPTVGLAGGLGDHYQRSASFGYGM
jgi:hypothetical protein